MTLSSKVILRRDLASIYLSPSAGGPFLELLRLEEKLEEARQQAMTEAIPYDLFLRVEERVRAILGT